MQEIVDWILFVILMKTVLLFIQLTKKNKIKNVNKKDERQQEQKTIEKHKEKVYSNALQYQLIGLETI